MKKTILILCVLFCVAISFAQTTYPNNTAEGNVGTKKTFGGNNGAILAHYQLRWYPDTAAANVMPYLKYTPDVLIKAGEIIYQRNHAATAWTFLATSVTDTGFVNLPFVTSIPQIGDVVGVGISPDSAIRALFGKSQSPLATLTGGGIFEFTSAATLNTTLNWSASRQFATQPLASIVVAGVTQSFSQPSPPGTVSGTQSVTVTTNTPTTHNNVVTTIDGKSATASTAFTYQNKIYAGFVTTSTPSDADIIAATGSSYVGGKFAITRDQSGNLTTPSGSKYVVFVAPASFGTPNVVINGLGVTYNLTTRTFINASGFSSSYIIAVSPFPTSGAIDTYLVN